MLTYEPELDLKRPASLPYFGEVVRMVYVELAGVYAVYLGPDQILRQALPDQLRPDQIWWLPAHFPKLDFHNLLLFPKKGSMRQCGHHAFLHDLRLGPELLRNLWERPDELLLHYSWDLRVQL